MKGAPEAPNKTRDPVAGHDWRLHWRPCRGDEFAATNSETQLYGAQLHRIQLPHHLRRGGFGGDAAGRSVEKPMSRLARLLPASTAMLALLPSLLVACAMVRCIASQFDPLAPEPSFDVADYFNTNGKDFVLVASRYHTLGPFMTTVTFYNPGDSEHHRFTRFGNVTRTSKEMTDHWKVLLKYSGNNVEFLEKSIINVLDEYKRDPEQEDPTRVGGGRTCSDFTYIPRNSTEMTKPFRVFVVSNDFSRELNTATKNEEHLLSVIIGFHSKEDRDASMLWTNAGQPDVDNIYYNALRITFRCLTRDY